MEGPPKIDADIRDPLMDDVISIHVTGLSANQRVTIKAVLEERGVTMFSYGCFTANASGDVDVAKTPSESGTYTGLSPMGLFWSMELAPDQPPGATINCRNASLPFVYTLHVLAGHVNDHVVCFQSPPQRTLCTGSVKRWYMAKGVQKVVVRSGRVRGFLFLPPGSGPFPGVIGKFNGVMSLQDHIYLSRPGPFPGVIDMFGVVRVQDSRSALLASRGFAVLCLAYHAYEDLPNDLTKLKLEYFMEAIDWLTNNKYVLTDGLGVIGISKGGEIALQMAYYSPKIKAVVSINGAPFLTGLPMTYQGNKIGVSEYYPKRGTNSPEGEGGRGAFYCDPEKYVPLWEKDVNVLLISGTDDLVLDPVFLQQFYERFPAAKRHKCQLLDYAGAGHLIDPPYTPLCRRATRVMIRDDRDIPVGKEPVMLLWGGQKSGHAHAQEDSWRRIIEHFRKHLPSRDQMISAAEQKCRL